MAETVTNWRVMRINGVEVVGSIEHLLWRLSDDNHALRPFVGDEAVDRLMTHIGDTVAAARVELAELAGEAARDRAAINRVDNLALELQKRVKELENELAQAYRATNDLQRRIAELEAGYKPT
jgi:chromosome segregation ATPase